MLRTTIALALVCAWPVAAEEGATLCDRHAILAGDLMELRHSGAPRDAADHLELAVSETPELAAAYADRAWAMPVPDERLGRSSQLFHFAEDAYIMCMAIGGALAPTS